MSDHQDKLLYPVSVSNYGECISVHPAAGGTVRLIIRGSDKSHAVVDTTLQPDAALSLAKSIMRIVKGVPS